MNGDELPDGWAVARLGDVVELVSGAGFPLDQQERQGLALPFFKVGNLADVGSSDSLKTSKHTISETTARVLRARVIPPNSVVFAKIGMAIRLNRRRLLGCFACIDNNMMAAIPGEGIDARYLLRFLETVDLLPLTQATTVPSLRKGDLEEIVVPIPPLAEQKRIIARIEEALERVNAVRARLARVLATLRRFRKAVLAAACEGRLTEDWREKVSKAESSATRVEALKREHTGYGAKRGNASPPTEEAHDLEPDDFPGTWALTQLEILCEPGRPITYGILKPGPHVPGGVPYVRVADYPQDRIVDPAGVRRTSSKIAAEYQRATLREGDLLLAIRGTFGRVCRVPAELSGGNITQDTARLGIHRSVNADYVAWCLRSPGAQDRMKRAAKGVAVRGINIGDVRALQIPVPPVDEQAEIVRRIEALLTLAEAIDRRIAASTAAADKLTQSIPAKAFRGQLVLSEAQLARREGREYESASALLARVNRAGRGAPTANKRPRTPRG